MKSRFSNLVDRIQGEGAEAWNIHAAAQAAKAAGQDVIVLSVGDPNFETPAAVVDAALHALKAGDTHYAAVPGREALRRSIADRVNRMPGVSHILPENTVFMAGAQCALYATLQCLVEEGDEVLAVDPLYVTYEAAIGTTKATLKRVPSDETSGFRPDFDRIQAAISDKTKALIFTSPNNPSGVALSQAECAKIEALALKYDLWVLCDEVYAELMYQSEFVSCLSLDKIRNQTVVFGSLSKSHAMTGWRAGWAIGPADLMQHLDTLALCMLYGSPGFVQEASICALTDDGRDTKIMTDAYKARALKVYNALSGCEGLQVIMPDAGMFCLVNIASTGKTGLAFAEDLFAAKGVSVLPGKPFGDNLETYVRLSFSTDDASLDEALRRIVAYVKGTHK